MADDRDDELQALRQVIETCRAHAGDLDMPALSHILRKAESSLVAHAERQAAPPRLPRGPALSVPRIRVVRH